MRTNDKIVRIKSIQFETGDTDAIIKGEMEQGTMRYESDLILSFSQLNLVINKLAGLNDNFTIEDYMETQQMSDEKLLYEANLSQLRNNCINLNEFYWQSEIKQIRA